MDTTKSPNILILMCDQLQGRVFHQDTPCMTPNLDKLALKGINFKNAYTPNPVCSPARASLMTGELPHNHGVIHVTHTVDKDQCELRTDHPHFAMRLKDSGYKTGYFGKWHVEHTEDPTKFGWDIHGANARGMNLPKPDLTTVKMESAPYGYSSDKVMYAVTTTEAKDRRIGRICSAATDYLTNVMAQEDPWCCFVSLPEPHDPYICYKPFYDLYKNKDMEMTPNYFDTLEGRPNLYKKSARAWELLTEEEKQEALRCYYGSITEIDTEFGKLIEMIDDQLDNTIVIFTSDHGDAMGAHGIYQKNVGAFEESYNVPLIMHTPKGIENHVSPARIGTHDIAKTLLELTCCEPIETADSKPFTELFTSLDNEGAYKKGYAEYEGTRYQFTQRIIYYNQWKLVLNGFDYDELYDLENDPFEMTNRIDDPVCTAQLAKMVAYFWERIKETKDMSIHNSDYTSLRLAPYGPLVNDITALPAYVKK